MGQRVGLPVRHEFGGDGGDCTNEFSGLVECVGDPRNDTADDLRDHINELRAHVILLFQSVSEVCG